MTHFTVLACLPGSVPTSGTLAALQETLAPYDEHLAVDPYRVWYEQPTDFPPIADLSASGRSPVDAGAPVDWRQIIDAYHSSAHLAEEDRLHLHDDGRCYTVSTRNPLAKWDYWSVGDASPGALAVAESLLPTALDDGLGEVPVIRFNAQTMTCAGGRRRFLDFARMRARARETAALRYSVWERHCGGLPEAETWPRVRARVTTGELPLAEARTRYASQPRVRAAQDAGLATSQWCPIEGFQRPRDEFLRHAQAAAVPGYALVRLPGDGDDPASRWMAPGTVGWFGSSAETFDGLHTYLTAANAHLDDLDGDAWVVMIGMHI